MRPDVVVDLPNDRSIVIDSKVSLSAYDRYVNAECDNTAAQALIEHITAIRSRIKELSEKNYAKAFGPSGLDFVLMFVPIEPALAVALQECPELQNEALNRKVALVSPMTLHIALRTVEYLWRLDTLSNSMEQIITRGRLVHDEAVRLGEAVIRLEKSINGSRDAFEDLRARLVHPSNGIIRRAQELYKLGVAGKSKKVMPEQLALAVDAGDCLTDADELPVNADLECKRDEIDAGTAVIG
jgi:DNA recombination protein RmuC